MLRLLSLLAALSLVSMWVAAPAPAAVTCTAQGKCSPAKSKPAKTKPAKKKAASTPPSREDFTPEQRAEILEYARQLCKKKFGAEASVYRLNYAKREVTCTNNTR